MGRMAPTRSDKYAKRGPGLKKKKCCIALAMSDKMGLNNE